MTVYTFIIKLVFSNGVITLNLALVFILTLGLYLYFRFYKYSENFMQMAKKIPGPRLFPIIGCAYLFGTNPKDILQNVSDYAEKYGDVSGYWIGPLFYVCIQKARDIEMVLGNNNLLRKSIANDLMKSGVGEGLITSSGEKYKKHRKLLQPTFHYQILENYVGVFISKSKILNDLLESQVDELDFNLGSFTNNFAYDILSETLMATKSDEQLSGQQAPYVASLNISTSIITCRFFKPWNYVDYIFYKTQSGRDLRHHVGFLHNSTKEIITNRLEKIKEEKAVKINEDEDEDEDENGRKKRKNFIDHLLEVAPENNLSDRDVLDEANTIMMAGFDTTSAAIGFLTLILSKRFDVQEKILEEVKEVFGTLDEEPFTYQDLQSLKYLDRVVRECLRLFPTIPYIARHISEDTPIPSGYTLPNGCGVIIPFIRLHRDPDEYPNPHVFDPDNFLPEKVAERHPYAFCPFSAGPRNCIGQRYATVQLKTFIVCLLRRFWITPSDFKLELASKITMISRTGIRVGLKKRTVERPVIPNIQNLSTIIKTNVEFLNVQFKDSYL